MDLKAFDQWCRSFLEIEALSRIDASLNGVQVARKEGQLATVAFAVDACAESIRRARSGGAQLLFVHHGLFWGRPESLDGPLLERLRLLLDSDIALYACHLPLDKHPEVGNNACLARALGLGNLQPFAQYHGTEIGIKGEFAEAVSIDDLQRRVIPDGSTPLCFLPGNKSMIKSVGIVSGGGAMDSMQALEEGLDFYITGEASHAVYHSLVESGLGFLAAGHYATEVWGVKAVAEKLARECGLKTFFIDIPTGL